uniref:PGG domain-containing protein n=1 Tax=Oryza punctata TaxID=4537 RepID=A0A0E0LAL4_ORYPU
MESEDYIFLWKWRKYLLLLATLVAGVTYDAGLNPPGGVWPSDEDGHHTGDPVLPDTFHSRYDAFFYCNATAFVASLVVIMMLLDRRVSGNRVGVTVLRSAMVLDLFALMGAYAAGVSRDVLAVVYVSALFGLVFAYVALHIVVATSALPPVEWLHVSVKRLADKVEELLMKGDDERPEASSTTTTRVEEDRQERRKFLLLLATFATPLTYAAGFDPPGGFWDSTGDGHTAGVPVLRDGPSRHRYKAFFYCNATSFVASLAIVMLLMSRTLSHRVVRSYALQVCVMVELLGLVGAYAAGSNRKRETTVYVVSLAGAVLVYIALQVVVGMFAMATINKRLVGLCRILQCRRRMEPAEHLRTDVTRDHRVQYLEMKPCPATPNTPCEVHAPDGDVTGGGDGGDEGDADTVEESRSLLLLLATLAATVTYDAGLNPPGGFWQDGDHAGELILLDMHPKRYKAFFHCNTAAFVASLVVIVIVQSKQLSSGAVVKRRALQAAMTLDLLGLMGAYAAGSCRSTAATIYVSALAVAVFVYSLGNVVAFTTMGQRRETRLMRWVDGMVQKVLEKLHLWDGQPEEADDDLERKRKFLLQLAILAATVTYKTGLNPPGGFWSDSDDDRAGDPVLLDHYRNRYIVFFYCNATGFMASVAVILMLVNRRLYKQGIRCNALNACVVVGLLGLMLAYAAGSCRRLRTSVYVIALVAAVIGFLLLQILLFLLAGHVMPSTLKHRLPPWLPALFEPLSPPPPKAAAAAGGDDKQDSGGRHTEQYMKRKYLMLLGVLAASVTYQAGLSPPGGTWGGDGAMASGSTSTTTYYAAGDPVLHDTDRARYHAFFHCNATSFVASVVVIVLLLRRTVRRHSAPLWAMQSAVVLDLLGLLGAYAAGSCREWETSVYVVALVVAVVVYITLHVLLSFDAVAAKAERLKVWKYFGESSDNQHGSAV